MIQSKTEIYCTIVRMLRFLIQQVWTWRYDGECFVSAESVSETIYIFKLGIRFALMHM